MSYQNLSLQLSTLANTLNTHHAALDGVLLAKKAATLEKSIQLFSKKVEEHLGGQSPGLREVEELLKSPASKQHIKAPALIKLAQRLFKEPLKGETLAVLKKDFLKAIKLCNNGELAAEELKRYFAQAAAYSEPAPKDKNLLQKELLRLGGLSDEEFSLEFEHRYKKKADRERLAKANAVSFSKTTQPEKLFLDIMHYARRAYANISR